MPPKLISTIASIATAGALIPGAASAQDAPPVHSIQIKAVTAYADSPMGSHHMRLIFVWFKMANALPDRATGVDGDGQQAMASRGYRCFQLIAGTKGHKLGPHGTIATIGSKHTLEVSTGPADQQVSDTITFKIRNGGNDYQANRAAARKRVGC